MRLLLDTHCWLWALAEPERLAGPVREALEGAGTTAFLSAASTWEAALEIALGRLVLPGTLSERLVGWLDEQDLTPLPVHHQHAARVELLPLLHRDPFDRILVAQAQVEGLTLATADPQVAAYDVPILWAGRGSRER